MVLQNASLLSSAMPKLYLCSKCSAELQSRMYCTFFFTCENTRNGLTFAVKKIKKTLYLALIIICILFVCVQSEWLLSGHMQVSLV